MIRVYPNKLSLDLDGRCDEFTTERRMTLEKWLIDDGGVPPEGSISIRVNGEIIDFETWPTFVFLPSDDVVICVEPKGTDPFSFAVALFAGVRAIFNALMPKLPGTPNSPGQGEQLIGGSAKGNKVKLGDVIRESAGRQKIYPDYVLAPHKYFASPREQWTELLLCIGKGRFQINANDVRIGDTSLISLGDEAEYQIFQPGEDVSSNPAATWWHSAPEVGSSSTGAPGLELTATTAITPSPTGGPFVFNGYSITIPVGSGFFPADWTVGLVLRIIAPYTYTVTDGGTGVRDPITGPLGMLNPTPGDTIEVTGNNGGTYIVNSYTGGGSPSMTLNFAGGTPATTLVVGTGLAAIGPLGLRFKITAISSNTIIVDRLDESGSVDGSFPGFDPLTSGIATISVDSSSLEGGWRGPFPACPENEKTSIIEWDVFYPNGLCGVGREGNLYEIPVEYQLQYRDMAISGAWTAVNYGNAAQTLDQVGFTNRLTLPYAMRPEVRMRKISPLSENLEFHDTVQWYGLRAKLSSPVRYDGCTILAVRVQTSDRIASQSENQVYVIATRILPTRSGGIWTAEQPTRDIAPWFAYVAKSQGYTDADLDLDELDRLDAIWKARNDRFDHAQEDETTGKEMLNQTLGAGFAEFTIDRGVIRPVRDEPRTTFEHMYTPQNMTERMTRDVQMLGPDDFDGVEVTFKSSTTWTEDVVPCRLPGDLGRRVEKITAIGVTDRDKAYQIGMRRRRTQRYRRDTYNWSTEMDALNSRYLSYCAAADDVPGYGQSALLLDWIEGNDLVLLKSSEPLDWSASGGHMVGLRRPDGTVSGPYVATRVDDYRLTVPSLDFSPDVSWDIEPPHILFGPSVRWTYPVLITSISPKGTTEATVEAVGYDDRVYLSDDELAP